MYSLPTPSLPYCLVFFLQMLKDLPTSPPPCLLRSWSGCSTSSLPDLIDWLMWVECNSRLLLGRSEGLHVELVKRTQPSSPVSLPFCILSLGMNLWSSHILGIDVSYLYRPWMEVWRINFPSWETAGWVTIKPKSFWSASTLASLFPPGAIQLQPPWRFMWWWWLPTCLSQTWPSGMHEPILKNQSSTRPSFCLTGLKSFVFLANMSPLLFSIVLIRAKTENGLKEMNIFYQNTVSRSSSHPGYEGISLSHCTLECVLGSNTPP